jgi:hypothetical protein
MPADSFHFFGHIDFRHFRFIFFAVFIDAAISPDAILVSPRQLLKIRHCFHRLILRYAPPPPLISPITAAAAFCRRRYAFADSD